MLKNEQATSVYSKADFLRESSEVENSKRFCLLDENHETWVLASPLSKYDTRCLLPVQFLYENLHLRANEGNSNVFAAQRQLTFPNPARSEARSGGIETTSRLSLAQRLP